MCISCEQSVVTHDMSLTRGIRQPGFTLGYQCGDFRYLLDAEESVVPICVLIGHDVCLERGHLRSTEVLVCPQLTLGPYMAFAPIVVAVDTLVEFRSGRGGPSHKCGFGAIIALMHFFL